MSNIIPFLKNAAFEPNVTAAMGAAFDKVCQLATEQKRPSVDKDMLASRIIELARQGLTDPDALYAETLKTLGLDQSGVVSGKRSA